MAEQIFLAVDLGASSGRVLAGQFDGGRLALEPLHRFDNGATDLGGHLHWDVLALWANIQDGLRAAAARRGHSTIRSIGVDTWGVDFALIGPHDTLLGNPYSYRDRRTQGMLNYVLDRVSREEIFAETGLQFMEINTLYQLMAMRVEGSPLLEIAQSFLLTPDFFHWLLSGQRANERTIASTTQFYNPTSGQWSKSLLERLEIPTHFLAPLVDPGTSLGKLRSSVAEATGLGPCEVIVPGTHDTASAVMAVPVKGPPQEKPNWCYISSGTWSLMGVETPRPVINDRVRQLNFTNEGGVGDTVRLLKNITGLWLVQECRRVWAQAGRKHSWDELTQMAAAAPALKSLINPDDPAFGAPGDMPEAVRAFCRRTGQPAPESEGAVVRACLEGLALKYRAVLEWLEELVGGRIETIHVVGGGTQNRALCQATADACARTVIAGPVEATAIGNIMLQAVSGGVIGSIAEARDCIRRSFPTETYEPRDTASWDDAYSRFRPLL